MAKTRGPTGIRSESWSYKFDSENAEGTITVAFQDALPGTIVTFRKPDKTKKPFGDSVPLTGIQLFQGDSNELTSFADRDAPKNQGGLELTIAYSRRDAEKIRNVYLTGESPKGEPIHAAMDIEKPVADDGRGAFSFTVEKLDAKKGGATAGGLLLHIFKWPKGDPLISHG